MRYDTVKHKRHLDTVANTSTTVARYCIDIGVCRNVLWRNLIDKRNDGMQRNRLEGIMKNFKQHSNPSHKRKKSNAEHDDDGGNSRAEEYNHQGKQNSADNHSRKQKSKTRPPDSSAPSSPKDTTESNNDLDKIWTTVTFDSKRMKDALVCFFSVI